MATTQIYTPLRLLIKSAKNGIDNFVRRLIDLSQYHSVDTFFAYLVIFIRLVKDVWSLKYSLINYISGGCVDMDKRLVCMV